MVLIRLKADYKAKISGIMITFLISVMILMFITNAMGETTPSAAAAEKNRDNTWLGTAGISNPDRPTDKDTPWSGCYVYFGTYDGNPIKFRVLARDSTAYTSGKALFLDSDVSLFEECFDNEEPYSNSWNGSTLQKTLNSTFLDGFHACEQEAIATSTGNGGITYEPGSMETGACGAPVSINDKVFLLDPAEVRNEAYGYSSDDGRDDGGIFIRYITVKKEVHRVPEDAGTCAPLLLKTVRCVVGTCLPWSMTEDSIPGRPLMPVYTAAPAQSAFRLH